MKLEISEAEARAIMSAIALATSLAKAFPEPDDALTPEQYESVGALLKAKIQAQLDLAKACAYDPLARDPLNDPLQ